MARTRCPDCDQLVGISPDRLIAEGFTARYWKLENHELPTNKPTGAIVVTERCTGSGKLI